MSDANGVAAPLHTHPWLNCQRRHAASTAAGVPPVGDNVAAATTAYFSASTAPGGTPVNCQRRYAAGLVGVCNPDGVCLADLSGYEEQRRPVIDNTLAFLEGKAANNILLYGDRGTGKSATVKAICNEYAHRGLRLVELRKENLHQLRGILEWLGERGLYFIVFIDDLSFETGDPSFTFLKGVLEGGVEKRPANVLVYATSNRRHFIHEKQGDRPSSQSDVRAFDTMQEQLSLADRFGLTVVFSCPSQDEYLSIAEFLGDKAGLFDAAATAIDTRQMFRDNALRWERWFNGRSPRTAAQYVDWLLGEKPFPWEPAGGPAAPAGSWPAAPAGG
jgi:predicted AAA+ superfamily ATPase